mmetsp:Transcript_72722/g.115120  ORF Transcript_72722/g.115120 Transcript_72722/m.115120 type:complete len:123 (-) Transcript_72722:22-390(-)|eukprot:CAMPEP_0169129686 /NCGR_PEP_ID=MMETSP1015-20121227/37276_1 /TAXON_ID=342587 /ORGANISM="Karlodinium micrum, Strain CCMP2283" /LENGTH=122 /DNA_ID=CAMNT_0009193757 /DNA_START=48 /DNA_END=416 /DNA_ORIENTATION=-
MTLAFLLVALYTSGVVEGLTWSRIAPPGYEDELYCLKPDWCLRPIPDLPDEFVGDASEQNQCFHKTEHKCMKVKTWGSAVNTPEEKTKLLETHHTASCAGADLNTQCKGQNASADTGGMKVR